MSTAVLIVLAILAVILIIPKPLGWTLKRVGPVLLLALCAVGVLLFFQRTLYMTVSITADGQKNVLADGDEVWLKQVLVDGRPYEPSALFSDGWINEDGYLKWRRYKQVKDMKSTITGLIPAGKKVELVFDSCKWRGIAKVTTEEGNCTVDTFHPLDKAKANTVSFEFPGKANAFHVDGHSVLLGTVITLTVLGLASTIAGSIHSHRTTLEQTENASPHKQREIWLDCAKVMSALFIVLIHTVGSGFSASYGTEKWVPFTVLNVLPRFAVPVFMMISGVLLLGKEITMRAAVNKAHKACALLLFWSLVYLFLRMVLWGQNSDVVTTILKIPVNNQQSGHLWYAYFLVWMHLFSPILGALYRALSRQQIAYLVCIAIFLPGLLNLYQNYFGLGGTDILPSFYLYMSFSYAAMMLLGRAIYDHLAEIRRPALWGLFLTAVGFCAMMALTLSYSAAQGKAQGDMFFSENKLFAVIMGAGVFLLMASLKDALESLPEVLRRVIEFVSKRSLGIYFFHCTILWMLGGFSVGSFVIDRSASPEGALLICAIAYAVSLYCVTMMSTIPLLKKTVM